jgi:hypothetical protein
MEAECPIFTPRIIGYILKAPQEAGNTTAGGKVGL